MALARVWQAQQMREQQTTTGCGTCVPLIFECGEVFQFD